MTFAIEDIMFTACTVFCEPFFLHYVGVSKYILLKYTAFLH